MLSRSGGRDDERRGTGNHAADEDKRG